LGFRTGTVALIGKPNVGKSTLVNTIVGQKVSIVSNKPQTTRRRVIGIANGPDYQMILIDTPGIHDAHTRLGRSMVEQARAAMGDVDVVLYVADGSKHPGDGDEQIAKNLKAALDGKVPIVICLNKMDLLKAENVVRNTEAYQKLLGSNQSMLTTATKGTNIGPLLELVVPHLPEQPPLYLDDEFTDQSSRFMVAEIVREKILLATRQEIPHSTAVRVDEWEEEDGRLHIGLTLIVEKASQRAILIGKQGAFIKQVGMQARTEVEELLGRHVFLDLHVKVAEDWRMNPRILEELEYDA
jgi:GTP-binding protein Era